MTSRSGFSELLLPYDNERRMWSNLTGLKSGLDPRMGAIIAEEEPGAGSPCSVVRICTEVRDLGWFHSPVYKFLQEERDTLVL